MVLHEITELKRTTRRLLEHERVVAIAQSREHLAWELHDSVGQLLGYVSMQVDAARKLLADGKEAEARRQLARLADTAREAHADVRGYIQELHAAPAGRQHFLDALRRELEAFTRNYGIPIDLAIQPALDAVELGHDEQTQVLRIVQEALTNARRHAAAHWVRVALESEDSTARIVIEDDGRGFDLAAVSADGDGRYGLRFMRERVEQLNGDLEILSAPGHGTRLVVRFPIPPGGAALGGPDQEAAPVGATPGSP